MFSPGGAEHDEKRSIVDIYNGSYRGKIKNPARIRNSEIHTTVAHWGAKVIMPIGAMKPITLVKVHYIGDIR
jgi:hypothetical protein